MCFSGSWDATRKLSKSYLIRPIPLLLQAPWQCLTSCFLHGAQQYIQMSITDIASKVILVFSYNFSLFFSCLSHFLQVARREWIQAHWWMHVTLLGNECNFTGALSNAFTPFCLESTGRRGDFHTDLWSWAGFWAVLHGFRFWRAGLRLPFLGLFLSTGGSSWGAHGGVWSPLWWLQLLILFIVNLLCALMGEQPRNSWLCNKISCPLVTATDRIQDQQPAPQGAAQVSTNMPCSTDWTPELSLATEMPSSL